MRRRRAERQEQILFSFSRWLQVGMLAVLLVVVSSFLVHSLWRFSTVERELEQTREALTILTQSQELLRMSIQDVTIDVTKYREQQAEQEEEFLYLRQNAYLNILRLAQDFPYTQRFKKQVYQALGENILQASSYAEIIYEMGRLPQEEYQARIMLETNPGLVTELSGYLPVFDRMTIPVRIPGSENDGKGFRITSGFSDSRSNPFGSGGFQPHYAVDIMNVHNISLVDYDGYVQRDDDTPGEVLSAADGRIFKVGYDAALSGNYVEITHPVNREILELYPGTSSWSTFYAHMRDKSPYKPGDPVLMGEKIGYIGNTGYSTGAHLHFEVRIYHPGGRFWDARGQFDRVNPYVLP